MSNYIDIKYINLLSPKLLLFKKKNESLYNFRCPYCGDSDKNQTKARGYVYSREGALLYRCHNCGTGASLYNLIKHVSPDIHREYVTEKFLNGNKRAEVSKPKVTYNNKPKYITDTPLKNLQRVSQLGINHPVKKYVTKRKIPTRYHSELFLAPKFYKFVSEISPDKINEGSRDEPRLIIPFIDSYGNLIGFQGRALGKSQPKYITIMLSEKSPKIFGLDKVDFTKPVFVLEGPIDSMFVDNSIAMAGADMTGLDTISSTELVFVYDNEPRNKDILKRMEKVVDGGHKVVIFPVSVLEKDINDMIMNGKKKEEVNQLIHDNTFGGLEAKARLSQWRKR